MNYNKPNTSIELTDAQLDEMLAKELTSQDEIGYIMAMKSLNNDSYFSGWRIFEVGYYDKSENYKRHCISDNTEGRLTMEMLGEHLPPETREAFESAGDTLGAIAHFAALMELCRQQQNDPKHRYVCRPYFGEHTCTHTEEEKQSARDAQQTDSKTIKAYLIDPTTFSISVVDWDGDYKTISKLIDADLFDHVRINTDGDSVFIDDNGLLVDPNPIGYFSINGQVLAGKGLILGSDDQGESTAPSFEFNPSNFAALEIMFLDREDINDQQIDPRITVTTWN